MLSARRKPSGQSHSIHLVAKGQRNVDVAMELPTGLIYPSLRLPQPRSTEYPTVKTTEPAPLPELNPAAVLRELFELLEDYSPVWYTEEHHDRAVAALKGAGR